jgi:hypothetical protein
MKPATELRVGKDGRSVRCGICGTTLGTVEGDAVVLLEGYHWVGAGFPHWAPSDRLVERHQTLRREAWRTTETGDRSREKLASGDVGGVSGFRVGGRRADGTRRWSYQKPEEDAEVRAMHRPRLRPDRDSFNDPVRCVVKQCGALNAVPPDLINSL